MKKLILFFLLSMTMFTNQNLLHACSCAADPPFCENVFNEDGTTWADLIVVGEKIGNYDLGMEVRIEQVLHGETSQAVIHVRRGNGADCGVNTDIFKNGDRLILALSLFTYYEPDTETYMLSICGATYLNIRDGFIEGRISGNKDKIAFSKLGELENCSGLDVFREVPEFILFPNPTASDQITLNLQASEGAVLGNLKVYDITGRIIRGLKLDIDQESFMEIPLYNLPAGMYFIELEVLSGRRVKKFIVQE